MDLRPSPRKWSASLAAIALLAALLPFVGLAPATAAPVPGVAAAIQFDGTNDYVNFGDAASLDLTTFTIETWFNRTGNGTSNTTGTGGVTNMIPLVTHGAPQGDGSNIDANWIFGINDATDTISADFEDMATGGNHPVSGTTLIANNTWHHAAATYDGTTWRLYLDGNLEATEAENATPRSDTIQRAGLGTMLPSGTGTPVGFFAGALDEPRVWNRALSANEIQTGMSQQLTSGSGLVARWGLNEGTDTTAADSIGTATGTLTNGPTWVDGGPFTPFAGCQPAVACGIRFDGTNDYVTFGDPGSLDLAQFTIETWFNRTGNGTSNTTGTGGILNAIPLVTHGAPQAEGSNVDADWILAINDATDVIAADFEDTATGANHPVSGTTLITNNVWHHAAATYDGTTWRLYLDGNLEATLAVNQTPRSDTIQRAALGTMLPSGTGTPVGFFAGSLDEPRVWNRALSANEIQTGMSQQLTSGSGLVARWGLNEGTATTAADSIGTATGTLTNGPVWTGGSPFTPFAGAIDIQLNAPTDGANGVGTSPTLDVTVTDPGNQPLDVTFFARPYKSGNFAQVGTDNGVTSGTNATFQWPNIGQGQTFEWYVTADNGPTSVTSPTWTFHTAATDPIFVGAGDIADCGRTQDTATGDIISGIEGTVWTTGDNVYPWGSAANYTNCYDTTGWGGSTLARTHAVPGNHDWGTNQVPSGQETLANYFAYYGSSSQGPSGESYYSYDIPSSNWHVVNLDSECQLVPGGCGAGSAQDQWLEADLAANSTKNVIALWHKPRYSSGVTTYTTMQPLWDDLYDAGVDLLLVGHDHVYERTAPMKSGATINSDPVADPTYGIRQFTVGTGGAALQGGFSPIPPSEVRRDDTYGVLKLTLHATTYDWQFLPIAGSTFTDSGSGSVHGAPAGPNTSPDAPVVNAPADAASDVSTSPALEVHVTDPDADPMTVRFYGRAQASGVYDLIDTVNNVPSGTDVTRQWTDLDDGHGYQWYVTLDDGTNPLTTGATWTFTTQAGSDPAFVGVGDIASCASQAQLDAAANTADIISAIQGSIFTTGDNVYPNGTAAEFTNCYDPSWGAPGIKSRTRPVPGNHDWGTGAQENLNDYFAYFGAAANSGGTSYYSYDIAGSNWHVVNLDSECQLVPGGCGVGSPQETWLKADLAGNSTENVIAVWHKPRFSSGATNYAAVQPFVDALYAAGADIVLVGHDHVYERQQPLDPSGNADATHGISYFTIGTGGESHHGTGTLRPTSQVLNNDTYGIMKFTLHANSYDWEFFPEDGETFTDSGTRSVHDAPVSSAAVKNDFDGDGNSDLLWRNSNTGQDYVWFMDGDQVASRQATLTEGDTDWKVAGTGDFDGDAKSDIMWRNSNTGQVYVWLMDGTTRTSAAGLGTEPAAWEIVGTGDFDGDGNSDLLWRNSNTGQDYVWFMDGDQVASRQATLTEGDTDWKVAGTGDFDGDAKSDIMWRNSNTGQVYVWLMDGTTRTSAAGLGTEPAAWEIVGTGDFDGDGNSDLLWRNSNTGQDYVWFMDGDQVASRQATLTEGDTDWKVAGTGDFDGDAKSDIMWRNSNTGQVYVWLMDGTTRTSAAGLGTEPAAWEIVGS